MKNGWEQNRQNIHKRERKLGVLRAVEYFAQVGGREAERFLQDAVAKGMVRGPGNFDIFVHPEFPLDASSKTDVQLRLRGVSSPEIQAYKDQYVQLLRQLMAQPAEPIVLLCTTGSTAFQDLYDRGRHGIPCERRTFALPARQSLGTPTGETGSMTLEGMSRLAGRMDGFHPQDRIRLHGATFGGCPTETAVQWYAAAHLGVMLPEVSQQELDDWLVSHKKSEAIRAKETMTAAIQRLRLLQNNTRVRMGTVFDCTLEHLSLAFERNKPGMKGNNATMQMVNKETVVIPDVLHIIQSRLQS